MAHECEECGQMCYCDGEDTFFEMPNNCRHWWAHENEQFMENQWYEDGEA